MVDDTHLPGDAAEHQQEAVVEVESHLNGRHFADPVLVRVDDVPHGGMVPGEGDAQPLGSKKGTLS